MTIRQILDPINSFQLENVNYNFGYLFNTIRAISGDSDIGDLINQLNQVLNRSETLNQTSQELIDELTPLSMQIVDALTKIDNLGYIGLWDDTTTYQPLNIVSYNGSSFIAKIANTNQEPDEGQYWGLLAQRGSGGGGGGTDIDKATEQQAQNGTNNDNYMTPLRVNNVTGTLSTLETNDKSRLTNAINEVFNRLITHENKIASNTELGNVKVDGTTITIDSNGVISAAPFDNLLPNVTNLSIIDGIITWTNPVGSEFIQSLVYISQQDMTNWTQEYADANATKVYEGTSQSFTYDFTGNVQFYVKVFAQFRVLAAIRYDSGSTIAYTRTRSYFYLNGNELNSKTGGWIPGSSTGVGSQAKNATTLVTVASGLLALRTYVNNTAINLTQFSSIGVKVNVVQSDPANAGFQVRLSSSRDNDAYELGLLTRNQNGEFTMELDVDSINSNAYIKLCATSGASNTRNENAIMEVWGVYK